MRQTPLAAADITHKKISPSRPQTNGKGERFNRTLLDEWAYLSLKPRTTSGQRPWQTSFTPTTTTRCHTALGGPPPISRVNNPPGQYT
ncbi:integrase core domain-containing protein [Streptomyces zhihengii]